MVRCLKAIDAGSIARAFWYPVLLIVAAWLVTLLKCGDTCTWWPAPLCTVLLAAAGGWSIGKLRRGTDAVLRAGRYTHAEGPATLRVTRQGEALVCYLELPDHTLCLPFGVGSQLLRLPGQTGPTVARTVFQTVELQNTHGALWRHWPSVTVDYLPAANLIFELRDEHGRLIYTHQRYPRAR